MLYWTLACLETDLKPRPETQFSDPDLIWPIFIPLYARFLNTLLQVR